MLFNLFKNKREYLPKDTTSCLITSCNLEVKLNTPITLPENVICFVGFKDKIYLKTNNQLNVDENNLNQLFQKQAKKNKNLKTLNFDLFLVNCNDQSKNFNFNQKIRIGKTDHKANFQLETVLKVYDAEKFKDIVLSFYALPTAEDGYDCVAMYILDFLKPYLNKIKLETPDLKLHQQIIAEKIGNILKKLGLELKTFKLDFSVKDAEFEKRKPQVTENLFQNLPLKDDVQNETQSKNVDLNTQIIYNNNQEKQTTHDTPGQLLCPCCKAKVITNAVYCHRCGQVLKRR